MKVLVRFTTLIPKRGSEPSQTNDLLFVALDFRIQLSVNRILDPIRPVNVLVKGDTLCSLWAEEQGLKTVFERDFSHYG